GDPGVEDGPHPRAPRGIDGAEGTAAGVVDDESGARGIDAVGRGCGIHSPNSNPVRCEVIDDRDEVWPRAPHRRWLSAWIIRRARPRLCPPAAAGAPGGAGRPRLGRQRLRSEEHTSELYSRSEIVCRL